MSPHSIAQSGDTLYVTEQIVNSIRTVHTITARVGTIVTAKRGGGYGNGKGTLAEFANPVGIVAGADSTLYVADMSNHRIRKVLAGTDADATQVSLLAGRSGKDGGYADDPTGTNAQFKFPIGLALSGTMLYVADMNNHCIRSIDLASLNDTVDTFAGGCGTDGDYVDALVGINARFKSPSGLAVDASGTTLYVADSGNHRIRAIDLASTNNTVRTIAGSDTDGKGGYADGAGLTAQFNNPIGLALSGTTLYVTDLSNHRIRAVDLADPNKTVSTIAGDGKQGDTNGIGTAARFSSPIGIAVARGSTLYVVSGRQIRKLEYREVGS